MTNLEAQAAEWRAWVSAHTGVPADKVRLSLPPVEPVPERCGAGRKADCCIFLSLGPRPRCERYGPHHGYRLEQRLQGTIAQRIPYDPYPHCMLPGS